MRYHKGLGIGHIYTHLKDDVLLTNGGADGAQDIPILAEDDPRPSFPEINDEILQDINSDLESSEHDKDDPDVDSDVISNHNGSRQYGSSEDGSADSSDLEYLDMYSNCESEDDD